MANLTDDQDTVLSILQEHGPTRFRGGRDLSACEALLKSGHIEDLGDAVGITPRGLRYLSTH